MDIGVHLRVVRKMHGLSQRELAKRAGVTNGTISLIEQNRVSPSISSLRKVLAGIPMSLGDFFTTDFSNTTKVFYGKDELTDLGDGDVQLRLVAANRRDRALSVMRRDLCPGRRYRRRNAEPRGRGRRRRGARPDRDHGRRLAARAGPGRGLLF